MYNKEYQMRRVELGRHRRLKMNCFDYCFFAFFKHLIHVFIVAIIAAFFIVGWVISHDSHSTDNDGFNHSMDERLNKLQWFIEHHPAIYGIDKAGGSVGFNKTVSGGLGKVLKNMMESNEEEVLPGYIVHPFFGYLQLNSPLHILKNFTIDVKNQDEITESEFYQNYLSQSIPLVVPGIARDWPVFKEIDSRKGNKNDLANYLISQFKPKEDALWKIETNVTYTRLTKNHTEDVFEQGIGQGHNYSERFENFI